jgi:hypothetical protein
MPSAQELQDCHSCHSGRDARCSTIIIVDKQVSATRRKSGIPRYEKGSGRGMCNSVERCKDFGRSDYVTYVATAAFIAVSSYSVKSFGPSHIVPRPTFSKSSIKSLLVEPSTKRMQIGW